MAEVGCPEKAAPATVTVAAQNDNFEALAFEKTLAALKNTQVGVQALSSWCLKNRHHHKRIVASWLNVLKRAKVEHRVTLFYLANDVIQYSKKKNFEFVESWRTTLQKGTPLVRDEKVRRHILKIFQIWEQRKVYDDDFLADLTGLLSATTGKQSQDVDPNDFQPTSLISRIKQCCVLECETDYQLRNVSKCQLSLDNVTTLSLELKERKDADQASMELEGAIKIVEGYVKTLEKELVAREELNRLLHKAHQHYATQRGEVKVVANAYRNFGGRVKNLKRKLEELCETLPSISSSPVPSPPSLNETVPSPGPDEDLELPNLKMDKTFNKTLNTSDSFSNNDFSSFLGSSDFQFSDFQTNNSKNNTKISPPPPPPPPLLPGLDLLATTNISEPPASMVSSSSRNIYGNNTMTSDMSGTRGNLSTFGDNSHDWNASWDYPAGHGDIAEPPAMDSTVIAMVPPPVIDQPPPMIYSDIDHRALLAPPPPPQTLQMLLQSNDCDNRSLPSLNALPIDHNIKADVDHRNLISLTGFSSTPTTSASSNLSWTSSNQPPNIDQDYRTPLQDFSPSIPPPVLPPSFRHSMQQVPSDNVESIDMEMSDEESHDKQDDYHKQMDSSLHGGSLSSNRHSHPPPPYKKMDFNNKYNNQNKIYGNLGDRNQSKLNMKKTEVEGARGNLVQINRDSDVSHPGLTDAFDQNPIPTTPIKDIFSDFNESMNPFNPNLNQPPIDFGDKRAVANSEWETPEDESVYSEPESWRNQFKAINPPRPSFRNMSAPFNNNSFSPRFRGSFPMHRPPPVRDRPDNIHRNSSNFRKPWGQKPPRPGRGNFW